jgi:hypothetical protein
LKKNKNKVSVSAKITPIPKLSADTVYRYRNSVGH